MQLPPLRGFSTIFDIVFHYGSEKGRPSTVLTLKFVYDPSTSYRLFESPLY